ncbi:MAG: glycosyltransferase [Mesorhizobium sp.]|nr:MAG: glycosyltransferase [Mesorhizobium sp.]
MAADALSAVAILIGNARARFAEFAALPAEAKAQLTVLGDDQCRATFEEQAARLGLSSRVTFAGAVEDVFPFCWTLIFIFRCRKACQRPATSLSSLRIVAWIPFGERACESDASAQEFSSPFRRCEPIETKRALSILDRLSRETLESVF